MLSNLPSARFVHDYGAFKLWHVHFPATSTNPGKSYAVQSYPDSDLLTIETLVTKRRVSALVGRIVTPQIRDAIARAAETSPK